MGSSRKLFFGALIGAALTTTIVIANGLLIAQVIIRLIDKDLAATYSIALLAALWAFKAIFTSQFDLWASREASKLKAELRNWATGSTPLLIATPSTYLSNLLVKGANSLDIYLARFLPQMFGATMTPIAVIAVLGYFDRLSALIAVLTLPIIPIFGALIGRYTSDAVQAKWQSLGMLGKYFEDSLRGIHTLAIFSRLKSQDQRIGEMGDRYTDETMKVLRISFLSALALELAATISVALIAVSIGLRLVNGSIDFYPSLAILVLAPEVYFPLRNAASLFHASADGGAALSELTSIRDSFVAPAHEGSNAIERVEAISWSTWRPPYEGLTSSIPATQLNSGDALVIRGGSGLGKTTFLNAILGFSTAQQISINAIDIDQIDKKSLRSHIGWIPQSPTLLTGTVRNLFTTINSKISDDEIVALLNRVGLHESAMSEGLDSVIGGLGEKSAQLSGGQIRRLAIARALSINPTLVVADEPTADLDPQSAQEILTLLGDLTKSGAIVIAVLHAPDHLIQGAREIEMSQ